ncbi:MAG: choice-of-anchor D domain-containing protein, partial [Planctomycetaceae bacterium]|nr:choice-of-anchor D domain-containing protein [Planctomycetaceae bacterium]
DAPNVIAAGASASFRVVYRGFGTGLRTTTVTIASDDADEGTYNFDVQATAAAVQIVDNRDADFAKTGLSPATGYGFQSDVHFAPAGTGSSTAVWTFGDLTPGQTYQVSATWVRHPNRAANAPFTVFDKKTLVFTTSVNQKVTPADFTDLSTPWAILGNVTVTGTTLSVELSNAADGFILADAVRLDPVVMTPEIEIRGNGVAIPAGDVSPAASDHTDFGISAAAVRTFTIHNFGGTVLNISAVTAVGGDAGDFAVTNVPAAVAPGMSADFTVTFTASANSLRTTTIVVDSDDADEGQYSFAVRATGTDSVIIDNDDPGFTSTGFSGQSGYGFGSDVRFASSGTGGSTAVWTFGGLTPGSYQVFATWAAHPNRATDAPYSVFDAASLLNTIDVSQRTAPNDMAEAGTNWELLGTFSVSSNSLVVQLSNNADGYVLADAVAVRPAPTPPQPLGNLLDNLFSDPDFSTDN